MFAVWGGPTRLSGPGPYVTSRSRSLFVEREGDWDGKQVERATRRQSKWDVPVLTVYANELVKFSLRSLMTRVRRPQGQRRRLSGRCNCKPHCMRVDQFHLKKRAKTTIDAFNGDLLPGNKKKKLSRTNGVPTYAP